MQIRVQRIRERDTAVVDTLDGYSLGFAEQMQQSYGEFRRTSYEEIETGRRGAFQRAHAHAYSARPQSRPVSLRLATATATPVAIS